MLITLLALTLLLKLVLLVAIAWHFVWRYRQYRSCHYFGYKNQQWWYRANSDDLQVVKLQQVIVWPWLCCLQMRNLHSNKDQFIAVLPDSVDDETWRQLRVLLRFKALA